MGEHRLEFTASENPWAPTAVIAEINTRTGAGLELTGLAEQAGGTSSAAYVRWPDGRNGALTRTDTPLDRMRQTAEVLAAARARGLPVPRHDLLLDLADGRVACVQERMPGTSAKRVDAELIDTLVAMNDRFADLLPDRADIPPPPAFQHLAAGASRTDTLAGYSEAGRALLARIREVAGDEPYEMVGTDLVHTDYNLGNILLEDNGHVSGVVDWNWGVARGDRRYALLGLAIHLATEGDQHGVLPEAADRLHRILSARLGPDLLACYRAALTLHRVHWSIRVGFPEWRIAEEIRRGHQRLG